MNLFDKVRAIHTLDSLFDEGPVEAGYEGYIVEVYHNPEGVCVEFCEFNGVLYESLLVDCTVDDLELVIAFEERGGK